MKINKSNALTLGKLVEALPVLISESAQSLVPSDLVFHSADVDAGVLFLLEASSGDSALRYARLAREKGAIGLLYDSVLKDVLSPLLAEKNWPCFSIENLHQYQADLLELFYGAPNQMRWIGVTGTNGKTSVCHWGWALSNRLGIRTGRIGTTGYGVSKLLPTQHTSPTLGHLYRYASQMHQSKAAQVWMEVSSHALAQNRLGDLSFETAVFTNLSQDHLDYHLDMPTYFNAKARLFEEQVSKNALVCVDDDYGQMLCKRMPKHVQVLTYGQSKHADCCVESLRLVQGGTLASLRLPWGKVSIKLPWIGHFQVLNLLPVIAYFAMSGYALDTIIANLQLIQLPEGRMQLIQHPFKSIRIFIDYAHTPDALDRALSSLKEANPSSLWVVFGAGGDRDKEKRALMGQIAARLADQIILTNDNPRFELPEAIIADIKSGISPAMQAQKLQIELDRSIAIAQAIAQAPEGAFILIAGKGHEKTQEIGGQYLPLHDEQLVRQVILRSF